MKRIPLLSVLFSMLLIVLACTANETVDSQIVLPDDLPDFVQESDFENIDWNRKAVQFGDRGIIGNENKSGVIGANMPSLNGQKWMWHLWGVDDVIVTIVGFHKESQTVHKILIDSWTKRARGANNGADTHLKSNDKLHYSIGSHCGFQTTSHK